MQACSTPSFFVPSHSPSIPVLAFQTHPYISRLWSQNPAYGRHWISRPMRIVAPIHVCVSNKLTYFSPKTFFFIPTFGYLAGKNWARKVGWHGKKKFTKTITHHLFGRTIFLAGEVAKLSKNIYGHRSPLPWKYAFFCNSQKEPYVYLIFLQH